MVSLEELIDLFVSFQRSNRLLLLWKLTENIPIVGAPTGLNIKFGLARPQTVQTIQQCFQYRAIMESDDTSTNCDYGSGATWCSPELKSR